jgi:tight adherence protein B
MIYPVVGLAFLAGFLLVFGVNLWIVDMSEQQRRHLREQYQLENRLRQRDRARGAMVGRDLSAPDLAEEPAELQQTPWHRFCRMVDQSGVAMSPVQLILLSAIPGPMLAFATFHFLNTIVGAALVAFLSSAVPMAVVAAKAAHNKEKLLSQLPDAFELMSRALRAGQTPAQALQAVADEFSDPISAEFSYCYEQQNLGLSPEAALRDLACRTDLLEIKIFVVAQSIHREAGGNLSVLLEKLSNVIRERYRIRGQIRALTAEGKLQAYILIALPFVVLGCLTVTSPDYIGLLLHYPWIIAVMIGSNILGALWMRSIINFDF